MDSAMKLDGTKLHGKSVRINPADSKPARRWWVIKWNNSMHLFLF